MPKLEVVNANNVIEYSPQKANFKLKNTGGPKGEPGAQGPKGDTGPQGPAGPQGIQGEKGDKGAQGERGPQGIQGPQGPQGIQGPKGDKGDKGNTGATGPQGPQGPAGQNGADGQDGADGFSPIATVTQEGLDAEISITDKNGTTTATVPGFGVQVVESLPATGTENVIYLKRTESTASGNPISIADAVEAPLKSLEIQGNTTQQTYTGKNLLNLGPKSDGGVAGAITDGSTITVTGTALVTDGRSVAELQTTLQAGTYTLTIDHAATHVINLTVNTSDGNVAFRLAAGETSITKTLASASTGGNVFWAITQGQTYNETFKLQLVAGSTADYNYEPYVGGVPAPNPDYPQAVQTVTGENVVKICGKNLWGAEEHGSINENTGEDVWNANRWRTVGYIPVKSNTAYTLSSNASADIWYIFCFYDSGKNFISGVAVYGGSQTQTTPANCEFMRCVVCDTASIKTTERQLELGSSSSSFEPYQGQSYTISLGSIELCKIGDYQDSIYKSGGKWYVRKEVGKTVLGGSEAWYNAGGNAPYGLVIDGALITISNDEPPLVYCDKFYPVSQNASWSSYSSLISTSAIAASTNTIRIRYTDMANLSAFQTWLGSNNTTLYYVLATPTDTEITNAALVAQLEAILSQGYTYNGTNNITTVITAGNEQGELEIGYYNAYDSYLYVAGRWQQFARLTAANE